jgi:TonB family protein
VDSRFFDNAVSRSVALHLLLLLAALIYVAHAPKVWLSSPPVEVTLTEILNNPHVKKSIVSQTAGTQVKEAPKAAYLSDRNRAVKEETSAQGGIETPSRSGGARAKAVRVSDLGVKISRANREDYQTDRKWAESQTGEALRGGQYIRGVKPGEVTALNTKEFVFYSYFERVRQQLDQAWQPIVKQNVGKILKGGRQLASNTDFVTRTLVTMNERGEILRIQLLEQSGTEDLDQAAIDALNKAGPYPNPPKGLIDSSGNVHIRWDFILKT